MMLKEWSCAVTEVRALVSAKQAPKQIWLEMEVSPFSNAMLVYCCMKHTSDISVMNELHELHFHDQNQLRTQDRPEVERNMMEE